MARTDVSLLTSPGDWKPACDAAATWPAAAAPGFFGRFFESVRIGDGKAYATGYYEPEVEGSRRKSDKYPVPVYARPDDLEQRSPDELRAQNNDKVTATRKTAARQVLSDPAA